MQHMAYDPAYILYMQKYRENHITSKQALNMHKNETQKVQHIVTVPWSFTLRDFYQM